MGRDGEERQSEWVGALSEVERRDEYMVCVYGVCIYGGRGNVRRGKV